MNPASWRPGHVLRAASLRATSTKRKRHDIIGIDFMPAGITNSIRPAKQYNRSGFLRFEIQLLVFLFIFRSSHAFFERMLIYEEPANGILQDEPKWNSTSAIHFLLAIRQRLVGEVAHWELRVACKSGRPAYFVGPVVPLCRRYLSSNIYIFTDMRVAPVNFYSVAPLHWQPPT